MPLHLLPKKSWNPYAPAAIARVRADEEAAAAREEADEQRQQQHDAAVRLALLRGETPPPEPSPPPHSNTQSTRSKNDWSDRRKRRRLAGEDDTDRDIRLARTDVEVASEARTLQLDNAAHDKDFSVTDRRGNIQLFAPPEERKSKHQNGQTKAKNPEAEAERLAKERELADQYTMRFDNAAGFKQSAGAAPWYAAGEPARPQGSEKAIAGVKNVWGRDDPGREGRDAVRLASADPMAAMKRAQTQLRNVDRERERWKREKEREIGELRAEQRERRGRKDSLERSTLDGGEEKHRHKHRHRHTHRHRHRSRSPTRRHSHHRRER